MYHPYSFVTTPSEWVSSILLTWGIHEVGKSFNDGVGKSFNDELV